MDEQEKERQSWAKFLNSDLTRHNLILGGLYLTSWELFRTVVIDTVRQFLANHPDRQSCIDSSYDTDVHYLNPRDRFHASCLWLQKMGAISDEDIARIVKIRNHRNQIAHELLAFISDVDHDIDVALLQSIRDLVDKVSKWWVQEVEIPSNPDYGGVTIKDTDFQIGNTIALDLIIELALGRGSAGTLGCELTDRETIRS